MTFAKLYSEFCFESKGQRKGRKRSEEKKEKNERKREFLAILLHPLHDIDSKDEGRLFS